MATQVADPARQRSICLVGNPNTGKSVIFGILTGKYVTVSNYPGTTVEVLKGSANIAGKRYSIIDTPGANSLVPMSEDERVTRDILLRDPPDLIIQIGDAKNLKRVLAITVQLAEIGLPVVLALNMSDEAKMRGIEIDHARLSEILGVPVVSTVAVERLGIDRLLAHLDSRKTLDLHIVYPPAVESAVERIIQLLPEAVLGKRAVALMYLSGDDSAIEWLDDELSEDTLNALEDIRRSAASVSKLPLSQVINRQRVHLVQQIYSGVVISGKGKEGSIAGFVGRVSMHPFWGVPFLFGVLWAMWQFVGVFGSGTVVDFIENTIFNEYINPLAIKIFSGIPFQMVTELFVGEYGIITMALTYGIAIVLPIVFTFFLAFGVLEDSGYLPRLAVMVNTIFRMMGLNGKAVLPMVLGLGCDTMATLTTRILESRRERTIVTLLLALGVPCSAQLGVILALLTSTKALIIWAGVVGFVLLLVGFLAGKIMPGQSADFILEVPPMRVPKISNILVKTLARSEWYLKEALPLFVLGTLMLFVLDKTAVLGMIERLAAPVVTGFLGLPRETAQAFIMGFLRRDYGGAGLLALHKTGALNPDQMLVSLVTITLFVPCIANFFVIIKERGWRVGVGMALFIVPFAILVGGIVRALLSLRVFG